MNEIFKYDYYRMTGNSYSFSFKAKFSLFLYHQLKFMYLWRKLKVKNNCINRARLYRLTKKIWFRNFTVSHNWKRVIFRASIQYYCGIRCYNR